VIILGSVQAVRSSLRRSINIAFSQLFWAFFTVARSRDFCNNGQVGFVMSKQEAEVDQSLEIAKARAFGTGTGDGGIAPALQLADLFNLCSAQIKKYEYQTQSPAYWSFFFAVVAMIAGIALLCCGAAVLFLAAADKTFTPHHIISGSIISTVGGAMSAYITKTFLDVHRTSLLELNHYFKQPVINSHILSAQRLADLVTDGKVREEMYRDLIEQVIALIAADEANSGDLSIRAMPRVSQSNKQRRRRTPASQTQDDAGHHDQHQAPVAETNKKSPKMI
jgi:hypothetical protein